LIDVLDHPDPPEVESLHRFFTGRLAFDVGANIGTTVRTFARSFDKVVAFEPCQEAFDVLRQGQPSNVLSLLVAATDTEGWLELAENENPIKSGQLTSQFADQPVWGKVVGRRKVWGMRLDDVAREVGWPDFVKVDVEGHEVKVLQGAPEVLANRPKLFIEVHSAELGEQCRTILDPLYGGDLKVVTHPNYRPGEWGHSNHYWLAANRHTTTH
jgi:FkbM family methyltransferase